MTCTVVGNCLFFAIFQDKLRLKFLIARLIAIKIFNRPVAQVIRQLNALHNEIIQTRPFQLKDLR